VECDDRSQRTAYRNLRYVVNGPVSCPPPPPPSQPRAPGPSGAPLTVHGSPLARREVIHRVFRKDRDFVVGEDRIPGMRDRFNARLAARIASSIAEETSSFISRRRSGNGETLFRGTNPLLKDTKSIPESLDSEALTGKFHSRVPRDAPDDNSIEGSRVRGILLGTSRRRLSENSTNTPCVVASYDIECEPACRLVDEKLANPKTPTTRPAGLVAGEQSSITRRYMADRGTSGGERDGHVFEIHP